MSSNKTIHLYVSTEETEGKVFWRAEGTFPEAKLPESSMQGLINFLSTEGIPFGVTGIQELHAHQGVLCEINPQHIKTIPYIHAITGAEIILLKCFREYFDGYIIKVHRANTLDLIATVLDYMRFYLWAALGRSDDPNIEE